MPNMTTVDNLGMEVANMSKGVVYATVYAAVLLRDRDQPLSDEHHKAAHGAAAKAAQSWRTHQRQTKNF